MEHSVLSVRGAFLMEAAMNGGCEKLIVYPAQQSFLRIIW